MLYLIVLDINLLHIIVLDKCAAGRKTYLLHTNLLDMNVLARNISDINVLDRNVTDNNVLSSSLQYLHETYK